MVKQEAEAKAVLGANKGVPAPSLLPPSFLGIFFLLLGIVAHSWFTAGFSPAFPLPGSAGFLGPRARRVSFFADPAEDCTRFSAGQIFAAM
jgi:hypothetical protein